MIRALAVFAMILAGAGHARAQDESCAPPDLAQITGQLIDWIERQDEIETAGLRQNPPEITFCEMSETLVYETDAILVEEGLLAAYDLTRRRIYLVEPWDSANPRARATLLHELVHVAQFDSQSWPCPQAAEWQAYVLQDRWLTEQGLVSGFNWTQVFQLTVCPSDVHP